MAHEQDLGALIDEPVREVVIDGLVRLLPDLPRPHAHHHARSPLSRLPTPPRARASSPSFLPFLALLTLLQAALKIIQHSRDNLPASVTGQLLGLDIGGVVDVTDCFPLPTRVRSNLPLAPCPSHVH